MFNERVIVNFIHVECVIHQRSKASKDVYEYCGIVNNVCGENLRMCIKEFSFVGAAVVAGPAGAVVAPAAHW